MIFILTLAVLTIATNTIFIRLYGINGAALGNLISISVYNAIKCPFIWIKFKIQPFTSKAITAFLVAACTFLAAILLPHSDSYLVSELTNMVLRLVLSTVIYAPLIYLLRVSDEANGVALAVFRKAKGWLR